MCKPIGLRTSRITNLAGSALVAMVLWAAPGQAQSYLSFAKQFSVDELPTTGFAVVNPASTTARLTFILYSPQGQPIAGSAQVIPARGQLARLGSELFPGNTGTGWVQAVSTSSGLQGFWLGGDFATHADGAEAAVLDKELVFPFVTADSELNVVNTSGVPNSVVLRLHGSDGVELGSATFSMAGAAVRQGRPAEFFPSADVSRSMYVRVSGSELLSGSAVVRGFMGSRDSGVVNAVSAVGVPSLNFPTW